MRQCVVRPERSTPAVRGTVARASSPASAQRVDAPALLDDGVDLVARQREHGLVDEFLRELLVAERPMHVAERLLDELRQRLAVA